MSEKDVFTTFNQDKIIECLTKQLSELELFQTMYSPREIVITNAEVIDNIKAFITREIDHTPNHLDYTLKCCVENMKLELSIHLPSMYPENAPELYVRCNELDRYQEKSLNTELTTYLDSKHDGEVCIFTAISWLQDNVESFVQKKAPIGTLVENNVQTEQTFSRYWIYSHHIYCKKKIEEMLKMAKEFKLTGFCLMGKPGVICIEGDEKDCKSWWQNIKTLNWQKIALKLTENFKDTERASQQKFDKFNIIRFVSPSNKHTDMGSFQKYVEKHGLSAQLTEFFGVYPS